MIEAICDYIHNYFTDDSDKHSGTFTISGGNVQCDFLMDGQYFKIVGSTLNDGIYQYPESELRSETFTGEVWGMKVPVAILKIAQEAEQLAQKNGDAVNGPYTSENVIGAYSYTKAANAGGGTFAWLFGPDGVFGARLNQWRKLA